MGVERIDYPALDELRVMLEDEFAELVDAYQRDTRGKIGVLKQTDPGTEHESIRKLVHSLKGASINLGLVHLGDYCRELEQQAKGGVIRNYNDQIDQIKAEAEFAMSELSRLI